MSRAARPHRTPLTVRLAAAVACAALALPAAPGPAAPAPARGGAGSGEVSFRGISQTPWVTRTGTWQLQLSVSGAPAGATVETRIHTRIESREEFNRALFGVVEDDGGLASIPSVAVDDGGVAPDGGRIVSLAATLRSEEPSRPGWAFLEDGLRRGVYPVEITVLDGEAQAGRIVVFLTRVPSGDEDGADRPPVLVAPVLPVGAGPTVDERGRSTLPDAMVEDVAATAEGLLLAENLPATLVPRPETIEALSRERPGREALAALAEATASRQTVDGPYVDIALTAWVARDLRDELTRQRERGHSVLTQHLGQVDSSTWLATEPLTPEAAGELWSVGVRTVILPPGTVEPGAGATGRPFTIDAGPGRRLQAVVPDPGLSLDLDRWDDVVLDHAALAAELGLLAGSDDRPEGVALVPPEGWPGEPAAVASLATVLLDPVAPVDAVTVASLLQTAARETRALRPARVTDLGAYPQQLTEGRSKLSSFGSLSGPGDEDLAALDQRLLLSGARSLSPEQRRRYVASVTATVDFRLAQIEAPTRQTITLTSRDGEIPLTLRSDLGDPVRVRIDLEADTRLVFPEGDQILRTLEPGTNQITIPVHARLPGDAPIDITVRTPDGAIVLDDVRYTVRSTAVSGIGLILSIGAALFLLLWWVRHWARTRRARRQGAGGPDPEGRAAALSEPTT